MENIENIDIENLMKKEVMSIEGKFVHIRVGTDSSPASDTMVKDIEDKIIELFEKHNISCATFVTHHAVDINIIESK